jgi:hypothetical protein
MFIRIQPEQIGKLNITVTAYMLEKFFFTIPDQIMKSVTVRVCWIYGMLLISNKEFPEIIIITLENSE